MKTKGQGACWRRSLRFVVRDSGQDAVDHAGVFNAGQFFVQAVAVVAQHSLDPGFTNSFIVVGREAEAHEWGELVTRLVSPGYFETSGLRVAEGRPFGPSDDAAAPMVVLVNRATVARYFPDHQVIGAQVRFWAEGADNVIQAHESGRVHSRPLAASLHWANELLSYRAIGIYSELFQPDGVLEVGKLRTAEKLDLLNDPTWTILMRSPE